MLHRYILGAILFCSFTGTVSAQSAEEILAANQKKIENNKKREAVNPVMENVSNKKPTPEEEYKRDLNELKSLLEDTLDINNLVRQLSEADDDAASIMMSKNKTTLEKLDALLKAEYERRETVRARADANLAAQQQLAAQQLQIQRSAEQRNTVRNEPKKEKPKKKEKPLRDFPLQVILVRPYKAGDPTKIAILEVGSGNKSVYGRVGSPMYAPLNGKQYTVESVVEDGPSERVRGRSRYKIVLSDEVGARLELFKD